MILTEKERTTLEDLKTQEQDCVKKYGKYAGQAKDSELKNLLGRIQKEEQKHVDSLEKALSGIIQPVDCNDRDGKNYEPSATYRSGGDLEDKAHDCFLATDLIGTEKLVSGEYNGNVFNCNNSDLRKLLADIQVEEQNHAEMLFKYKQANCMN